MLFSERIGVKIAELPGWQCGETGPRPAQPHWAQANVKVVLLIPATCHVAELPPDTWTLVHYSLRYLSPESLFIRSSLDLHHPLSIGPPRSSILR